MPAYDLRIFKSWGARNLSAAWVNSYVFNMDSGDVTSSEVVSLVEAVGNMEKALHLAPVQFLHATFSTVQNEPTYNPLSLRVLELQGFGNIPVNAPDEPLDLNIALKLKKNVAYGRSGTMFYRGALLASDVNINSRGESELAPDSKFVQGASVSSAVQQVLNLPTTDWVMKTREMDDPNFGGVLTVRSVLGMSASGISINKRNHGYFDSIPAHIRKEIRALLKTGGNITITPNGPPALPDGEVVDGEVV